MFKRSKIRNMSPDDMLKHVYRLSAEKLYSDAQDMGEQYLIEIARRRDLIPSDSTLPHYEEKRTKLNNEHTRLHNLLVQIIEKKLSEEKDK